MFRPALIALALAAHSPAAACQDVAEAETPLLGYVEVAEPVPHCGVQALTVAGSTVDLMLPEDWSGRLVHHFDDDPARAEALLSEGAAILKAPFEVDTMPLALDLIEAAYGRPPDHVYGSGSGSGGLEVLEAGMAVPGDYDGLYLVAPALGGARAALQAAHDVQTLGRLGPRPWQVLTPADLTLVAATILADCDGLDGIEDGLIFDIAGCRAAFDPFQLTCAETSQGCVFPERLEALVVLQDGPRDADFVPLYAPWPWTPALGGEDWRATWLGGPDTPALRSEEASGELAEALGRDAVDLATLDIPAAADRIPDIAPDAAAVIAFGADGGRILVLHPAGEARFSVFRSGGWIEGLQDEDPAIDEVLRLYAVPDDTRPDLFGDLVAWVEEDRVPGALVGPFGAGERPLCPWPLFATNITGEAGDEGSFICAGSG